MNSSLTKKTYSSLFRMGILLSLILSLFSGYVVGDWGDSDEDCMGHHGITPQYARYIPDLASQIVLDGIDNESVWNRPDVYDYIIPVMNINTTTNHYIKYVHMKYLYDDSDLYIRTYWDDTTIPQPSDNFFVCWDINCTNFSVGMFLVNDSMETLILNERSDSWMWQQNFNENMSTSTLVDQWYDHNSWVENQITDVNDPVAGSAYGTWLNNSAHYQIEIKRSLTTVELDEDTQFLLGETRRFAIAIDDSLASQDHAVSWTYELYLTNGTDVDWIAASLDNSDDTTSDDTGDPKPTKSISGYSLIVGVILIAMTTLRNKQIKNKLRC